MNACPNNRIQFLAARVKYQLSQCHNKTPPCCQGGVSQLLGICYGAMRLRHCIGNHQLRLAACRGIAAEQAENVGNGVVVIIQLEAQADLGQAFR
jgi:hypothetical protein